MHASARAEGGAPDGAVFNKQPRDEARERGEEAQRVRRLVRPAAEAQQRQAERAE
jgi:hypothetical protein